VADCWRVYEELRSRDERAWQLLLSETIHPNMNGHKVFAEEIVHTVTGARVDLTDVGPPQPALPATWARLAAGQPVRAVAMPPFDALIGPALERVCPGAQVGVTSWPVAVRALAQIEAYARDGIGWQHFQAHPEDARPDLVLIAVPPEADAESEEAFIRSYSWVLNWSLSFGAQEWDCAAALPSVVAPAPSPSQHEREALARQVIQGQDIGLVERPVGETGSAHELLARWVAANVGEGGA